MRKETQGCVRSNVRINVHLHYPRNPRSIKAKSVRKALICPRKCPPRRPGKCCGQTWASASGAGTRATQTRDRIPRQRRCRSVPHPTKNHPAIVNDTETKRVIGGERQESEPSPIGRDYGLTPFRNSRQGSGVSVVDSRRESFLLRRKRYHCSAYPTLNRACLVVPNKPANRREGGDGVPPKAALCLARRGAQEREEKAFRFR